MSTLIPVPCALHPPDRGRPGAQQREALHQAFEGEV